MNIGEQKVGNATVLSPEGRLDSNTADQFSQAFTAKMDSGEKRVIIDFSDLEYISSAGLRVLLMAAKRIKAEAGALALCGLKPQVHEVFEISGFVPLMNIVADQQAALGVVEAA